MVLEEKTSIETEVPPLLPTYEEVAGSGIGINNVLGATTISSRSRLM